MGTPQKKTLRKGEFIFHHGEVGDCAYFIEQGRVVLFVTKEGQEIPISVLGEGEIIGELALLDTGPRTSSARAMEDCTLIIVSRDQLMEKILDADAVVRLLMRFLIQRFRRLSREEEDANEFEQIKISEEDKQKAIQKIKIENKIHDAFLNKEFTTHYQPIVNLKSRQIVGCEELIRWISIGKETLPAGVFMDVVENSSMVLVFGRWIIEKSIHDLSLLLKNPHLSEDFFMSINISGKQLYDPRFVEHLEETRKKYNLSPKNIKLEVTERIMADGTIVIPVLDKCRSAGYKLAVDDFGTGFSSLQYLASMPLTGLKIDRSFVMNITTDARSRAIVRSLISLSQTLNLDVVAEGVETMEQAQLLKKWGAGLAQGFFYAKPIPFDQLMEYINNRKTLKKVA